MKMGENVMPYFNEKLFLVEECDYTLTEARKVQLIMEHLTPYYLKRVFPRDIQTLTELAKALRLLKAAMDHQVCREEDESLDERADLAAELEARRGEEYRV